MQYKNIFLALAGSDPMTITLTWQSIITAGAVVGALVTIITLLAKLVRWVDKQKAQDAEIKTLQAKHDKDIEELKDTLEAENAHIRRELSILCYGMRGTLQGLIENGCNGPCKDALNMLDKHLNKTAHNEE